MKKTADDFLKKVKQYEKSKSRNEKQKNEMHEKQFHAIGHSEASQEEEAKAMGFDVKHIIKDFAKSERELKKAHKIFLKGLLDVAVRPYDVALPPPDPNIIDLFPPAFDGFGGGFFDDEDCGFNLALGESNFIASEQGSGWGLMAVAYGEKHVNFVFRFIPPRAGNILVEPHISFKGAFAISAHDHRYTSTHANIRLRVSSHLFQHYWEQGPTATIIDEYHRNSSNSGTIDHTEKLSYSTSVSANDPVRIFVKLALYTRAHSSHARVDVDFKTGASRRVKVPLIRIRYIS